MTTEPIRNHSSRHEDYGKAAAALVKSRHTFATQIGQARRAFRELWYEGETPSRPWGADRRATKPDSPKMQVTYRLTVRRRAAQTRASRRQASKPPHLLSRTADVDPSPPSD
jgi:hypothetical protein